MSLTQPSFTSQCQAMQQKGVQFFIFAGDTASLSRIARDCTAIGFKPAYGSNAQGVNEVTAKDPRLEGIIVGNGVFPWPDASVPATNEFQTAMRTLAPSATLSGAAALAWSAAAAFGQAVSNMESAARSGPITSDLVLQGLYKFKNETLGGLIPPTTHTRGQQGSKVNLCYTMSAVRQGKWIAPSGDKAFCVPPPPA
jgi:branched-chain amino acid transport system substrate-binding protein